jgi:hypothetical protein
MNYAISTYSKNPDLAFEAAMCLRSPGRDSLPGHSARRATCR